MYKVLVCDDEKDIVSAISIYLTSDGYEVIPARNGLEALDIVKHNDVQSCPDGYNDACHGRHRGDGGNQKNL